MKRHQEATVFWEDYYHNNFSALGPDHARVCDAFCDLGYSYDAEGRYGDTETLCQSHLGALANLDSDTSQFTTQIERWMEFRAEYFQNKQQDA
jgi:hypothetical protein